VNKTRGKGEKKEAGSPIQCMFRNAVWYSLTKKMWPLSREITDWRRVEELLAQNTAARSGSRRDETQARFDVSWPRGSLLSLAYKRDTRGLLSGLSRLMLPADTLTRKAGDTLVRPMQWQRSDGLHLLLPANRPSRLQPLQSKVSIFLTTSLLGVLASNVTPYLVYGELLVAHDSGG
jgi:hypothetical protein